MTTCDSCGSEMKLDKTGHVKTKDRHNCRVRRFYCSICDITKTIYADGMMDDNPAPLEEPLGQYEESAEGMHCIHGYLTEDCVICKPD